MSLKDALMLEAQNIETSVELDSIFESADLSADTRAKFATVFESVVKAKAVALAESHIEQIAEKAEAQVEEKANEKVAALSETVNKYFDHLVENWMEENRLAVENGIKVQMFDSLLESMKETFIEHNIVVPAESVDVVAEMEEEIAEAQAELNAMIDTNKILKEEIQGIKRDQAIAEATASLTDVAKSKVATLTEGLAFDTNFEGKLAAIVEMVSAVKETTADEQIVENTTTEDEGLNFTAEEQEEQTTEEVVVETKYIDPEVAAFLR